MAELERIGVSLDKDLRSRFDKLISEQGYQSRSEAIRDLVRQQLSERRLQNPQARAVAAVFLVYDHHSTKLTKSLIDLQHTHTTGTTLQVISSLHVHLDEHDCLEVIVLRGRVEEINHVAERILSMKGVKLGRVNVVAT
ncbi:MAG: nickel-responsive transcriptional regulator NikR [Sedimentisphaerales bacterium]